MRALGKRVYRKVSGVRISPSPPVQGRRRVAPKSVGASLDEPFILGVRLGDIARVKHQHSSTGCRVMAGVWFA